MKNILVTGGAGYIGSHMAAKLIHKGYKVYILDNLSTGSKKNLPKKCKFFFADICDKKKTENIFKKIKFDCVFHFAACLSVPESEKNPKKYYFNNIYGTTNILDHCVNFNVKKIIFSSTCAVYGSVTGSVHEKIKTNPESNYGKTKLICENIIKDYKKKFSISYAILRYFNVIGVHPSYKYGQYRSNGLFKNLTKNISNNKNTINLYGNNYPTRDKTCIRDYIDVNDLVELHYLSYKKIKKNLTINCGYNKGYSVKEIITLFENISGKRIKINVKKRRPGDVISIYSNNKLLNETFPNWKRKYSIQDSIINSFNWEKKISKND